MIHMPKGVIPQGTVQRIGTGRRSRKIHNLGMNTSLRIGTTGRRNQNSAARVNPMQSTFKVPVGGSIPSNNEQSGEIFATAFPETTGRKAPRIP